MNSMRRTTVDLDLLAREALGMAQCLVEGGAFAAKAVTGGPTKPPAVTAATPGAVPPAATAAVPSVRMSASLRPGIHALEVYVPRLTVLQSALEVHDKAPGKYTVGLQQKRIAFCGDNEDATSMALTALARLMQRTGVSYQDVGRLEVGTESMTDRSKSIKTSLMRRFMEEGNTNVEGVDTYNACYGGTAALFNTVAWIESSAYQQGKFGVVVAVDVADWDAEHRWMNGAACVAMLVGPNAPLEMLPERFSHFEVTFFGACRVHGLTTSLFISGRNGLCQAHWHA